MNDPLGNHKQTMIRSAQRITEPNQSLPGPKNIVNRQQIHAKTSFFKHSQAQHSARCRSRSVDKISINLMSSPMYGVSTTAKMFLFSVLGGAPKRWAETQEHWHSNHESPNIAIQRGELHCEGFLFGEVAGIYSQDHRERHLWHLRYERIR